MKALVFAALLFALPLNGLHAITVAAIVRAVGVHRVEHWFGEKARIDDIKTRAKFRAVSLTALKDVGVFYPPVNINPYLAKKGSGKFLTGDNPALVTHTGVWSDNKRVEHTFAFRPSYPVVRIVEISGQIAIHNYNITMHNNQERRSSSRVQPIHTRAHRVDFSLPYRAIIGEVLHTQEGALYGGKGFFGSNRAPVARPSGPEGGPQSNQKGHKIYNGQPVAASRVGGGSPSGVSRNPLRSQIGIVSLIGFAILFGFGIVVGTKLLFDGYVANTHRHVLLGGGLVLGAATIFFLITIPSVIREFIWRCFWF